QEAYRSVLESNPENYVALHLLGVSLIQQGQPIDGIPLIEHALRLKPDLADAHYNLGCVLHDLNRLDEAITHYNKALAINPDHGGAHLNLGNALQALDLHEEAIAHYKRTLALRFDDANAYNNWGNSLQASSRHVEAIACYERALAVKPDHAQAHNNLGNSLSALNRYEEAIARYEEALALNPAWAEARNNLGYAMHAVNRFDEALALLGQALVLKPDYAEAHNNSGMVLHALNRHEDAIMRYDDALALRPDYAEAQWNKGLALLCLGRFRDGWQLYEKRWQRKQTAAIPDFNRALWPGPGSGAGETGRQPSGDRAGETFSIAPKRRAIAGFKGFLRALVGRGNAAAGVNLLLQYEQGFGDAIQMLRYVALLEQNGVRCWIQAPPELAALAQRSFPRSQVVPIGQCPAEVQFRIPMLSLPLALETFSEAAIPRAVPYLAVDERKKLAWAARLTRPRERTVGLVWRGRPAHKNDRNRSVPLETLLPLLSRRDMRFVTLQKDLTQAEFGELAQHDNVTALDQELVSFDDTAAVVSVLDLVISVDSAPAHLSGALGKATWVLLPFSPDWRWLLARSDCPWYPSARLFRQSSIGDWAGVVDDVAGSLRFASMS
ncbi:MAG: tetratricopeptide repeat protein, partial [Pseudomonadota bacterium]